LLKNLYKPPGSHARRIYIEAARKERRWNLIEDCIDNPTTAADLVEIVQSLIETGKYQKAFDLLNQADALGLDRSTTDEIKARLEIRAQIGS
jgi:dTDP-4-dehydrorhamnose reductase